MSRSGTIRSRICLQGVRDRLSAGTRQTDETRQGKGWRGALANPPIVWVRETHADKHVERQPYGQDVLCFSRSRERSRLAWGTLAQGIKVTMVLPLSPMATCRYVDRPDCPSGILSSGACDDVHGYASTSPSQLATAISNAFVMAKTQAWRAWYCVLW